MLTIYEKVDGASPESFPRVFEKAAEIVGNGGIVAFPTETVYGLGADVYNESAIRRIYEAKGRPADNPLIAHISSMDELAEIASDIPEKARKLMEAYWPGPLAIILKKNPAVPDIVSCGLDTIGVRLPENRIARMFIAACGRPIAAPSANLSGRPSPTEAAHVLADLGGKIDMIIDGGPCVYGLESTIADCAGKDVVLLRPGAVTRERLCAVCGSVRLDAGVLEKPAENMVPRAPGQKYKHYAPKADMTRVFGPADKVAAKINSLVAENADKIAGVLATDETKTLYDKRAIVVSVGIRANLETVAAGLFESLRKFDELGVELIYSEAFAAEGVGLAIMNRLYKAAGYKMIYI